MASVPLKPFLDSSGTRILLGKKIGSGGEGDVYDILPLHSNVVAKIYHKPLEPQKQEKLLLMVRGCNDELKGISAWPTDVLRAHKGGPVVGFLMPKISDYEPVHKVYGPTHRKEHFPHADWRFLVRTAKNLAAAFFVIHKFGYVIGDVNEGNILVNQQACVRLIDCDSFQVRTNDQLYYCEVGVAQFTPPEIQNSKHFKMERTANHDNFGLSILCFQLLFFGRHPFSGVYTGKEDMPLDKAIAEFRFAYSKNSSLKSISPPPNSVGLSVVPNDIAGLFERAFSESGARTAGRPPAGEWWDAFESLEKRMRRCSADSVHSYYSGLSACPWCRLEESSGLLLFLSADKITKIDLRREWQKVEAITPPGPIPYIDPGNFVPHHVPLAPDIKRSLDFRSFRQITGMAIIAGCVVMALGEMITDYLTILPIVIVVLALFLYPGEAAGEKKRRLGNLDNAQYMWDLWNKKWITEAGDSAFHAQLNQLRDLKRKYENIDREYRTSLLTLERTMKERQQKKFLEHCSIDQCTIPRIGTGLKNTLKSLGIMTAANITRNALHVIPQLDNTLTNELLAWREKMERNFLFDPTQGIDKSDLQIFIHKYQPMIRPVERDLMHGTLKLRRIQEDILKKRITLRPAVEKRARELAQAEADFDIFSRTPEELIRREINGILHPRKNSR
jgi:DNA-binding helix-hairpin-helix protein with protein kinase domain